MRRWQLIATGAGKSFFFEVVSRTLVGDPTPMYLWAALIGFSAIKKERHEMGGEHVEGT